MATDVYERLADCTGFEWDEGNAPKVAARHNVEPGECEQAFFREPFLVVLEQKHSGVEDRWQALGRTTSGRWLLIVFTIRADLIRVIAARDMNRKERERYEQIKTQT
ncbi:MAG: BrnT family toxin [Gemmatimonadota bacterium]